MKTLGLKFAGLLMLLVLCVQQASAADYFPSLSDRDDVSTVYLSKALLGRAGAPLASLGRYVSTSDMKVESLSVYESSTATGIEACKRAIKDFQKTNKDAEVLLRSRDEDGEVTVLYGIPDADTGAYSLLVVYDEDAEEVSIVAITGRISLANE